MINYAKAIHNRRKAIQQNFKDSKKEIEAVVIPADVEIARTALCNACVHSTTVMDQCDQTNCFLKIMISSPVLRCPVGKWKPFLS